MEVLPPTVASLLDANSPDTAERAWAAFLEQYSSLLMAASARVGGTHDETMDHYAYVLDRLREDDFRRLRGFTANGSGKFTTWLVVVVKRLSIDHHRQTHGRSEAASEDPVVLARRNLADHVGQALDVAQLPTRTPSPDGALLEGERAQALADVLAALPTRDQLLLTLRYVDGHPPEKVGRMLGIGSRFQVYRRLKTVVRDVRSRLEARGVTGP